MLALLHRTSGGRRRWLVGIVTDADLIDDRGGRSGRHALGWELIIVPVESLRPGADLLVDPVRFMLDEPILCLPVIDGEQVASPPAGICRGPASRTSTRIWPRRSPGLRRR